MDVMTLDARLDRLDQMIEESRIIRGSWTLEREGREYACLLVALAPECDTGSVGACPAHVMPWWMAELTPWLDDAGSIEKWPAVIRRFAAVAHRWSILSDVQWQRVEYACLLVILREAIVWAHEESLEGINAIVALCERAARGEEIELAQWATAAHEVAICSDDGDEAAGAAWFATSTGPRAVREAADDAVSAAHTMSGSLGASTAAADRIIDGILTAIENAVVQGQAA